MIYQVYSKIFCFEICLDLSIKNIGETVSLKNITNKNQGNKYAFKYKLLTFFKDIAWYYTTGKLK